MPNKIDPRIEAAASAMAIAIGRRVGPGLPSIVRFDDMAEALAAADAVDPYRNNTETQYSFWGVYE